MDPVRFDALTRVLGQVRGRRHLLSLLTALPLVGALTGMPGSDAEDAQAGNRSRRRRRRRSRKRRNNNGTGSGGNNQNQNPPPGTASPPALGVTQCGNAADVCFQDSDCCNNNCFNFQCAARVLQCSQGGNTTNCRPPAKGCAGLQCCYGAVSCNEGCCQAPANQCNPEGNCCAPNCAGRACGPDGCGAGGTCGTCPSGQNCTADGQCQGSCVPQCRGKQCGPDGCGGTCGTCPTGSTCNDSSGQCLCTPDCTGKQCGSNGCGASCGTCGTGQSCTATGQCQNVCNAQTCPNGCCDTTRTCQLGTGTQACGTGGADCQTCQAQLTCSSGTCCMNLVGILGTCSSTVPCCSPAICQSTACCLPSGVPCQGPLGLCCSGTCGANGTCT